jgi:hypothetical protein
MVMPAGGSEFQRFVRGFFARMEKFLAVLAKLRVRPD